MHRTVDEWKRYAEERKGRPGALPAVTEVLEDLLALGDIADKHMRLLISSRQWLGVLIDEFDIGPATTVIEVNAIGPPAYAPPPRGKPPKNGQTPTSPASA